MGWLRHGAQGRVFASAARAALGVPVMPVMPVMLVVVAALASTWACTGSVQQGPPAAAKRAAARPTAATKGDAEAKLRAKTAAVEARRRTLARGAVQAGADRRAGGSRATRSTRYGNSDPASEVELAAALAHTPTAQPARALDRLESFNVLDAALVDPATGEVVLLGHTDPTFATGPLPYRAWLADAVANPAPVVSLDPIAGSEAPARLDADLSRIAGDAAFGMDWLRRLVRPVLERRPDLPAVELAVLDGQLARIGIRPEEYAAYADWVRAGRKRFANKQQYLGSRRCGPCRQGSRDSAG